MGLAYWKIIAYNKINQLQLAGTISCGARLAARSQESRVHSQRLPSLTADDTLLLQRGLATLEAAMEAAEQPVPTRLSQLRNQLRRWPLDDDGRSWPDSDVMSSREVADMLGVSPQQVHQLGKKGTLEIAKLGHPGRGSSTLYSTESVRHYSKHRPSPGRRPKAEIGDAGKEEI